MQLKPGLKLKASGTTTEVIVIQAPGGDVVLTCGGSPMSEDGASDAGTYDGEVLIGKRYCDEGRTIELLCSKSGPGPLALGDAVLAVKAAQALPSSD